MVDHVDSVIWYDSIAQISIPMDILPDKIKDAFNTDHSTVMAVFFDTSTSADETMEAINTIRDVTNNQCFVSGMSAMVTDLKNLCEQEEPIYVAIAVLPVMILDGFFPYPDNLSRKYRYGYSLQLRWVTTFRRDKLHNKGTFRYTA